MEFTVNNIIELVHKAIENEMPLRPQRNRILFLGEDGFSKVIFDWSSLNKDKLIFNSGNYTAEYVLSITNAEYNKLKVLLDEVKEYYKKQSKKIFDEFYEEVLNTSNLSEIDS